VGHIWWTYKPKNSNIDVHCLWKDVDTCELPIFVTLKIVFMAEVGYSGTPLVKKLGIRAEMKVLIIHEPDDYFSLLGITISNQYISKKETPDFVHLFAKNHHVFKQEMKAVLKFCKKNSSIVIWVSWYKKSSGINTDLSENLIREFALQNSLVDVKVCAVSEDWSGLKLVVPLAKR
jgi:hypothetical protein